MITLELIQVSVILLLCRLANAQLLQTAPDSLNETAFLENLDRIANDNMGLNIMQVYWVEYLNEITFLFSDRSNFFSVVHAKQILEHL